MTVLDLIAKAAGLAGPELLKLLQYVKDTAPDLAPLAEEAIAKLTAAISPEALAVLGSSVLHELVDIGQGNLDGRSHPSDAA